MVHCEMWLCGRIEGGRGRALRLRGERTRCVRAYGAGAGCESPRKGAAAGVQFAEAVGAWKVAGKNVEVRRHRRRSLEALTHDGEGGRVRVLYTSSSRPVWRGGSLG